MQAIQDPVAPNTLSLQYDVMREIFTLLGPYNAGGKPIDHETALQSFLHRRRERDAAMVGLRRPAGNERVAALGDRS